LIQEVGREIDAVTEEIRGAQAVLGQRTSRG
jgi:hypothetical protein